MAGITSWSEENVSLTALRDTRNQPFYGIDVIDRTQVTSVATFGTINAGVMTQVRFTFFTPTRTITVGAISNATGGTAANYGTATGLECRMGLYTAQSDSSLTLVARTDHDATLWTSTNAINMKSFSTTGGYPATYTLIAGTRYACAAIIANTGGTMTTSPNFYGVSSISGIMGDPPRIAGQSTSYSTLPTSASVGGGGNAMWFRLT